MTSPPDMPLFRDLPRARLDDHDCLVLASGSPRRAQLLQAAGYRFEIRPAGDEAECGMCSRETAPQMVARYAFRKAADVAAKLAGETNTTGDVDLPRTMILAADTVASCVGQILGKPKNRQHAESMLRTLSGRKHDVYTGVCLWSAADDACLVDVVRTQLRMQVLTDDMIDDYLDSMLWEGKAGAFGYQDGNTWLTVVEGGSESNVVGLPMERLVEMFNEFETNAVRIDATTLGDSDDAR